MDAQRSFYDLMHSYKAIKPCHNSRGAAKLLFPVDITITRSFSESSDVETPARMRGVNKVENERRCELSGSSCPRVAQ